MNGIEQFQRVHTAEGPMEVEMACIFQRRDVHDPFDDRSSPIYFRYVLGDEKVSDSRGEN